MAEIELKKWKGVLWADGQNGGYIAFCPKHRLRLEIWNSFLSKAFAQEQRDLTREDHLLCPEDDEHFEIFGSNFASMVRRFGNYQESVNLKSAKVYDLDNIYTPV